MVTLRHSPRGCVVVAALALAGCTAHFSGAITIDGQAFVPVSCRSGAAYGGLGIEMADATGRRLRLGANVDGSAGAALFQPGAPLGEYLGGCGPTTMTSQHSRINGITNMQGIATLSCQAAGHRVQGQIWFQNCH